MMPAAASAAMAATSAAVATTSAASAAMRRSPDRDVPRPATGMRSSQTATVGMCVCRAEHRVSRAMPRKCHRPTAGRATGNHPPAKTRAGDDIVISAAAAAGGIMHPDISGENGAAPNRSIEGRIDNNPTPGPIDITPAPYWAIRSKLDCAAEPDR